MGTKFHDQVFLLNLIVQQIFSSSRNEIIRFYMALKEV